MRLPRGRLVRSRVVSDPGIALASALDRELTGYAVFEPQDTLLLSADGRGVITFETGVPVLAYDTGTDRGGPPALGKLATPGPYRLDLYELDASDLAPVHDTPELEVPPGMPAERLAGDPGLAERTLERAPDERVRDPETDPERDDDRRPGAVEAFLDDEEKIEAIRERARAEAADRAEEWEFDEALDS